MQNISRALAVCVAVVALAGCGGPEDKEGKSLKAGEMYVMTKKGLEHVPHLRDKQGNKLEVGKEYLMTAGGLELIPFLKDKSGSQVEVGNEYIMTPEGLKLIQSRNIRGAIHDLSGKPVQGVDVAVAQSSFKAATGANGVFMLPFLEGYVRLTLHTPSLPEWCSQKELDSVFLSAEQYPSGLDLGVVKLPCMNVGTSGDKIKWATADMRFIDNADGTLTDTKSGLMWEAQVNAHDVTWSKASDYAESLVMGGHTDWRLPTPEELQTLHEAQVACAWHGPAVISGAITLWSAEQKSSDSALTFNVCSGKGRASQGLDEGPGTNPSALAVRGATGDRR